MILLAAVSAIPALSARRSLETGKESLTKAQTLLADGNIQGAGQAFAAAKAEFEKANSAAGSLPLRIEGWIPLVGRTADSLHGITQIGVDVSNAGVALTSGVSELPEGLASLAPHGGQLPLAAYSNLQPAMSSARQSLEHASAIADGMSSTFVLGPVSDAAATVRDKLDAALPLARSADELLKALPAFAGADGPRHYFVAAQNPAEARGTGGLIGEYSTLTFDNGKMSLARFRDINDLKDAKAGSIQAPNALADLFGTDIATNWTNTNSMPDVPTAASMAENLWSSTQRSKLDGAIYIDPGALPFLLQATGPVVSKELGVTLTPQNVVPFVTNKAYFIFGDVNSAARI
jgi:hypothetical protein